MLIRIIAITIIALLPCAAAGQTRKRSATKPSATQAKKPKAATTQQQAANDALKLGAMRVNEQLKTLTKFIYLLGGITKTIEAADEAARENRASPAVIEQTEKSKQSVRASIRNLVEAMDQLELHFRMTPDLARYYGKLAGVAAGAANAEAFAAANEFDKAGRALLEVVNKLGDVLVEMK